MKRFLVVTLLFLPGLLPAQESCDRPGLLFSDTGRTHFSKLAVNSDASDFSPTAYRNGFVFVSSRPDYFAVKYTSADSLSPLLDLYYFEKKDSAAFTVPKPFSAALNTSCNEGPASFSKNGVTMIFTRSSRNESSLRLYSSENKSGKWQTPVVLPFCKAGFNYVHPALAANDSVLYFSSDQPGGYGGMDLYYSRLTANGWSAPVNAGGKVNTSSDEVFPFCSAFGNLYFSSDRSGGEGQLDVYVLHLPDSVWRQPVRLAAPVNSSADDFGFWCSADESEGFVSSNRNAAVTDDNLYYFQLPMPQHVLEDTLKEPVLCYTFFEAATAITEDTAGLAYEWSFSDGTKTRSREAQKCFDTTGAYRVDLNIVDTASGEVFETKVSYELEIAPPNRLHVAWPDTFVAHRPLHVDVSSCKAEGYTVTAAVFDFGEGYRAAGWSCSHVYHQSGIYYPGILFCVKNDSTGVEEYWRVTKQLVIINP